MNPSSFRRCLSACATVIHSSLSCRWYSSETKISPLRVERKST
ncbi:Uncharacterised protein [Vibrio cholerae]|nr:Uncharacterised protein [Vibrio cholerae]